MTLRPVAPSAGRTMTAVLLMLGLGALSGCGGQGLAVPADEAWIRTKDDAAQFSVELPEAAQMENKVMPLATGEELPARLWAVDVGEDGGASFVVMDLQGQPVDLAGALTGAAAGIAGQVVERVEASQDGLNAVDGTVSITRGGIDRTVHLRIIDTGESMVILQSFGLASDGEALAQLHQHMLDSVAVPE